MCTSCKVQINGKGGQFSVAEGGQFYIAANNKDSTEGELLHKAYQSACALFSNVLTPDSDKNHHNHIHLDKGIGLGC
jgi:hypothetical protein